MICLNEDKRVKVWLSANFLVNSVKVSKSITEHVMVNDIFNIFWRFLPFLEERPPGMNFR